MLFRACLIVIALSLSPPALAGSGDVCRSSPQPVPKAQTLTAQTLFKCSTAGKVTIPQLYEKGWRVVFSGMQLSEAGMSQSEFVLIIEKL